MSSVQKREEKADFAVDKATELYILLNLYSQVHLFNVPCDKGEVCIQKYDCYLQEKHLKRLSHEPKVTFLTEWLLFLKRAHDKNSYSDLSFWHDFLK